MNKDQEQIEVRECYLSSGAESFIFQCAIQKYKDQDTQDCYSVCFVWVSGLASHPEGIKEAEGVRQQVAEEDIWA
jgi:hypothetical protein